MLSPTKKGWRDVARRILHMSPGETTEWRREDSDRLNKEIDELKQGRGTSTEHDAALCCYIEDADHQRCETDAEFDIYGESGAPDDITQACEAHIGALLGSHPSGHQNRSWTVYDMAADA